MNSLISCHIVGCNKLATNRFVAKPFPNEDKPLLFKYYTLNYINCLMKTCTHSRFGFAVERDILS